MTHNLKIEVLTGDISIDGMVVTNLVTKEELSTAIVKKADLGTDGKIPTSQLPAEIVNTAGIVDEVKLQLETSIKDAVDESNAYAESYTDNALSSKADLTSGKVPLEQLPTIDQYPQFGTTLRNLSTSILSAMKQRTDQLEKTKADLGEDGKVLREQIPSYEKISGLPEQLEVMSTQTAAVSRELDEHKLQTSDQIDTLKENINSNSEFLIETMDGRLENYADKDAVKRGIANRYDSLLTYNSGERVVLNNGDIVKSTIYGNANDPNSAMAGWVKTNSASQIFDISGLTQQEINGLIGSPLMFGAKGDGVFDDTLAIQACANNFQYLDMRNGNWKTSSKITITGGTVVDLRAAYLSANNANEPVFEFENAGDGLSILGGGGYVYGTADSFLKCSGKTYQPTMQNDYARRIRLDGLHVGGGNIDKFLDFDKAVRQVFLTHVFSYTKNGIFCNGKCVEFEIYGSIIYGAKGTTDLTTYGIKYRSPGNGRWYNEGLHITDSTIDNFGTTFDITDIYVMSITGGHIGAAIQADGYNAPGALVAKFGQPTSTACRNIKFANVNIYGNIEFAPVGGVDYQAKFTGCSSEMCDRANIFIKNNASSITVSNHTFHSSTNGVAVVCHSNNFNISVNDITCDSTFVGGVHVNGAIGDNVSVRGISYAGTGDPIYYERPILISGVPVATAGMANYKQKLVNAPWATYAVSQTIATVSAGFAKGETGEIVIELSYSGATPTSQILAINTPVGLVVPNGSSWSSRFVLLKSESGTISARIPYFVTKSIASGDIALVNFAGSALALGYHAYFGFKRDW